MSCPVLSCLAVAGFAFVSCHSYGPPNDINVGRIPNRVQLRLFGVPCETDCTGCSTTCCQDCSSGPDKRGVKTAAVKDNKGTSAKKVVAETTNTNR